MTQKHSIIIGGTKGVGRELANLFASEGQIVTAVGRNPETIAEMSETTPGKSSPGGSEERGQVFGFRGDVAASPTLLEGLRAEIIRRGKLSSLVFLQRYRGQGDSWAGELKVSLEATRLLIEGLADQFAPLGDRSIVVVTSNAGSLVTRSQPAGYHVAKAALHQLARFYAVKLGPQRIRVNVVSPSAFIKLESAGYYESRQDLRELYARITPLGRMGTAVEVAQVVAFLCSPKASFVTGQELCVDGGLSLMLQDALAREVAGLPA